MSLQQRFNLLLVGASFGALAALLLIGYTTTAPEWLFLVTWALWIVTVGHALALLLWVPR